jgi:LiaF transmembrane domain
MCEKRTNQIFAGVMFVTVGGLLIAQQVSQAVWLEWSHFWPIIIVGMGLNQLIQGIRRRDDKAGWGLSLMVTGSVLTLHTEQILSLRQTWPVFVIAQGVGLVLNGRWQAGNSREVTRDR